MTTTTTVLPWVDVPRVSLGMWPTALVPAPRLSEAIGLQVLLKRDDLTGIGPGGNKVRGLEFLLAAGVRNGCDVFVTGSGPQSNWSLLAALAAQREGMDVALCFYGDPPRRVTGNLLLHELSGADIRFTGSADRSSVDVALVRLAERLRQQGRRPLLVPRGGATGLGSIGYAVAAHEIATQVAALGLPPATTWSATGSCGMQAGLVVGAAQGWLPRVVGVTVSRPATECRERVLRLADEAALLLGVRRPRAGLVEVVDGWIGPGYGRRSAAGQEAARLLARLEAVLVDPVFGAKALAALLHHADHGLVTGPVVFVVSGGMPTLFAQEDAL